MSFKPWMIATVSLCTLVANAEVTRAADSVPLRDITLDEARDLITGFRVHARAGTDGATSKVEIEGRLPKNCVAAKGEMRVEHTISDKISLRIQMTEEVKSCIKDENKRIDEERDTQALVPLRDLHGINGSLDVEVNEPNDKEVVFVADRGRKTEEKSFNPPLHTVSRARLQKERADTEAAQRADLIRRLNKQYEKCQSNVDSLQTARNAVQKLMEIAAINGPEYEFRMSKLDEAEKKSVYNDLKKRIENGTFDELDAVREELREFAENNPELAKHAAHLSFELAKRSLEAEGEMSAERYAFADSVLVDAQGFDLDAPENKKLKNLRSELEVEKVSYYARSGDMGSMMLFQFNYPKLAQNSWKRVQTDCYSRRPSMEACAVSMKMYQRIQYLPQELNEGQHRMQQNQLNQMRMMQAAMGGGGYTNGSVEQQGPTMPMSMSSFDSRGMFGFVPSSSLAPSYTINNTQGSVQNQNMGLIPGPITLGSPWN
jgi:hypothetical protein